VTTATPFPRRFSVVERARLAAEVAWVYLRVRRLLRRCDLPTTLAALRCHRGSAPTAPQTDRNMELRLARAVAMTLDRLPADARCLSQSLVLTRLLTVRGIPSTLVIGVSDAGEMFGAHAWVERDGLPLLPVGGAAERRLVEL
jgi:Transglutaminase-like superfamily